MASNKELIAQAITLAAALEIEITTDGLNNKQLGDLVSDLKAKTKDAEHSTQADGPAEAEAEADAKAEEQAPGVYVAKGKSITSKAGILSAGDEVTAKHLAGGDKALAQLVKGGHCVKVK
jgi:hypothetical protein